MSHFLKIYGILLLSGLLMSCEDVFNQRVFIKVPSGPEKLVLLTDFENRNSPLALLSVSGNDMMDYYNYGGNYKPGPEADVEVFEEGKSLGKMMRDTMSTYMFSNKFIPRAGKNYEIRVKSKEYGEIWASGTVPSPVSLHAEVTGKTRKVRSWGAERNAYEVKLSFKDQPEEANFYRLSFVQHIPSDTDSLMDFSNINFYSDDLIFSSPSFFSDGIDAGTLKYIYGSPIFNDNSFNGNTKEIYFYVMGQSEDVSSSGRSTEIIINLQHLSKDAYQYEFTRRQAWDNDGNPFVQPVVIHNNIRGGGLGAFNTYSINSQRVKVTY